jgi:hypothetical protein
MQALTRKSFVAVAVIGLVLGSAASALARSPSTLSDRQLDLVTAGNAANVFGSSDSQAGGAFTVAQTSGNSFVVQGASPYPGQPELGPAAGMTVGTALSVGSNLAMQNAPPAGGSTSVTTGGSANGNLVINTTQNHTVHGAGGVTFQVGWTFVYGAFVGF